LPGDWPVQTKIARQYCFSAHFWLIGQAPAFSFTQKDSGYQ
jgi:hypothetical protein